jgi:AraC-like DNA-binding protein
MPRRRLRSSASAKAAFRPRFIRRPPASIDKPLPRFHGENGIRGPRDAGGTNGGQIAPPRRPAALADILRSLGGQREHHRAAVDLRAVELAREYLAAHAREQTFASTLEQITGTDRFTLARHFRRALGTSPDRYRTMRRLALARAAIERGLPLARAAAQAGFADQSHMTRQFKRTYGLTPGRWTVLTGDSSHEIAGKGSHSDHLHTVTK